MVLIKIETLEKLATSLPTTTSQTLFILNLKINVLS